MSVNVFEMNQEIHKISGSNNNAGVSILSEIESGISDITSFLKDNSVSSMEISNAMTLVATTVLEMSAF